MKSGRDGLSHFRTGKGARNEGRNCPVNEGGDELGVEGHPEFCYHSPLESGWRNRRALGFTEGDLGQVTPMGKEKTRLSSICRPSLGHTDGGPQGLPPFAGLPRAHNRGQGVGQESGPHFSPAGPRSPQ